MNDVTNNPFASAEGAERYASGRPFHHRRAVRRIFDRLGNPSIHRALDVACGTGLSTRALTEYADVAVGVDSTDLMIRLAPVSDAAVYAVAEGERLPFRDTTFGLVTVSSGVHWLEQDRFFAETTRVLEPQGWVAIYDHLFRGCTDDPAVDEWLEHRYQQRYPWPARSSNRTLELLRTSGRAPSAAGAGGSAIVPDGFTEFATFEYDDPVAFTHVQLVSYLLSHSNTIGRMTRGEERTEHTRSWLIAETAGWFEASTERTFLFRGVARCLQRNA